MANLLIVGASRGIGFEAVKHAMQIGHSVTAFSRKINDLFFQNSCLQRFSGDARNSTDMAAALEGTDAVIMSLGIKPGLKRTLRRVNLFSESTRVLLAAMAETDVRRLVAITGLGASESRAAIPLFARPAFDLLLGNAYDDEGPQERLIANSETDWTIIRPGIFFNRATSNSFKVLEDPGAWRPGLTSRSDVAVFAVDCAAGLAHLHKVPVVLTKCDRTRK
jgi:putative NADH-flavin reductase